LGLFVEKAKYLEPDNTVLQILENDLYEMIFYKKELFSRKQKKYLPSVDEKKFLNNIKFDIANQ
jgi:hypothetical protein